MRRGDIIGVAFIAFVLWGLVAFMFQTVNLVMMGVRL